MRFIGSWGLRERMGWVVNVGDGGREMLETSLIG